MAWGMSTDTDHLRRSLREAGLGDHAIEAAWPSWWSEELANDASGRAELRFALARRLGLSPRSLVGDRVEFVWNDEALFKNLSVVDAGKRAALTSFGMTVGRSLLRATAPGPSLAGVGATELRDAVLAGREFVDLASLLGTCWALGVPVIHLRVFPLDTKSMHAMVVSSNGRHAILLGRDATYPAPVAFTLAHEIGHAALDHLGEAPALLDMEDPAAAIPRDEQEAQADRYALTLLTGRADPTFETGRERFNAPTLAGAVREAAARYRIEPGTLALCLAYRRRAWPVANAAMRMIYDRPRPVWREVNGIAALQLDWGAITADAAAWLRTVMDTHG